MHTPITALKSSARESGSTTVVEVVRKLFNLRTEAPPAAKIPSSARGSESDAESVAVDKSRK